MDTRKLLFGFICALGSAGVAQAATVNVVGVSGAFTAAVGQQSGLYTGVGTDTLGWGASYQGGGQSKYLFEGSDGASYADNTVFSLGTFTHRNATIVANTSITSTAINITVGLDLAGVRRDISTAFTLTHWETNNRGTGGVCADGGAVGAGRNINGCADRVRIDNTLATLDEFQLGDAFYVLEVSAFWMGSGLFTDFWTAENMDNSAQIMGRFVKVRDIPPPPPPSPVPVPASGALLLAGLAGLARMARSRR